MELEVSPTDVSLRNMLWSGRVIANGESMVAIPTAAGETVRFELKREAELARPAMFAVWLQAIRAISLTATFTPCIAVVLYGMWRGYPVRPLEAVLAILGALLLQVSVNLSNDVEDHLRLIDLPGSLGGGGMIQKGWLSARSVSRVAKVTLVLGLLAGVPAFVRNPLELIAIGALAGLGTLGYSGWPFGLKYKALGDLAVFLMCGPCLTLGMSFAAFGRFDLGMIIVGLYFGLAAVGILHANNFQDMQIDRERGAMTVAHVLRRGGSRVYFAFLYVAAFASVGVGVAMRVLPVTAMLPIVIGGALATRLVLRVVRASDLGAPHLRLVRIEAAQTHLALGVLFIVAQGAALYFPR